jgi:NAD(P)-dependent dehydrogenase (short-subunit alcohol dehydrogenase family)
LARAQGLLHAVQEHVDDLRASSKEGGGWVLNVTSRDGRFGCGQRRGPLAFGQAGTLGLCKTLAREIPGARVKCVDLAPELAPAEQEQRLVDEFFADDALSEVGHDHEGRWTLRAKTANVHRDELGPLPLDRDSVVLITGGAAGVTAAAAHELARLAAPRLILVGRSPLPAAEDAATSQHRDKAALRRHLLEQSRLAGEQPKPAELETRVKRLLKDREIRENIAALRAAGSEVDYRSVDVRDPQRFADLIDYAAANEVLNKLAAHLGAAWPGRVVAINWGPWHGGMVSDELLRQYAARNISTIGLAAGARSFPVRSGRSLSPTVFTRSGKIGGNDARN